MATLYDIRRENLKTLVADKGNTEVAKAAGYSSSSYLSQMVGPKSKRPVTEATARKVERALGLPHLWLDAERDPYGHPLTREYIEHFSTPNPPVESYKVDNERLPDSHILDTDKMLMCASLVSNVAADLGVRLSTTKFKMIVNMLMDTDDQSENTLTRTANQLVKLSM